MFTVKDFRFDDPAPGIPLRDITPFSSRALALLVRNREKQILATGFENIYGAIDMIEGLEYHYQNLITWIDHLSTQRFASQETERLRRNLRHEMIAYLNRMGQFYYFA